MRDDANGTIEGIETHGGNETPGTDVNNGEDNDDPRNGEVSGAPKMEKLVKMDPKMQSQVD